MGKAAGVIRLGRFLGSRISTLPSAMAACKAALVLKAGLDGESVVDVVDAGLDVGAPVDVGSKNGALGRTASTEPGGSIATPLP